MLKHFLTIIFRLNNFSQGFNHHLIWENSEFEAHVFLTTGAEMHCGPAAAAAGPMGPPMDFSGGGMSPLDAPRKRKSQRKDAAPGNVVKCAPDLAQTGI